MRAGKFITGLRFTAAAIAMPTAPCYKVAAAKVQATFDKVITSALLAHSRYAAPPIPEYTNRRQQLVIVSCMAATF